MASFSANAAGMGKITVLSALGQPLRAELDITATREEQASLAAKVASVDAFRQANLEYTGTLSAVKFKLDKRPDGRPYFKIFTDRPISDPFIDMLVELSWASGRLVREYAFLLDPPADIKSTTAPVAVVDAPKIPAPAESVSATASEPSPQPVETVTEPKAAVPEAAVPEKKVTESKPVPVAQPKVAEEKVPADTNAAGTHEVKPGDTLGKIAVASLPAGVTLNQMLVALFNSNRDAFSGGNMNRLRAGKILTLPDASVVSEVGVSEARKIVVSQLADFNAYRNTLATSAAQSAPADSGVQQSSGGAIAPMIEEKSPAAEGKDKLSVSRSEADATAGKLSEEDRIARQKALSEANSRIADLEKNLGDLKQLAEIKSQAAAPKEGGSQGGAASENSAASAATLAVPLTTEPPALSSTAAPLEQPIPKKKKPAPVSPASPLPQPSFLEENASLVYGAGAAIVALLGFLGYRNWKRKRDDEMDQAAAMGEVSSASILGMSGSDSASDVHEPTGGFDSNSFDENDVAKDAAVDPVQEAEVYMAYGRDSQAEEILHAAKQKDPGNLPVYVKLLEIYAGRNSLAQFGDVAAELHERTGGNGPEWQKAADLGRSLDPGNPLFGGTAAENLVAAVDEELPQVLEESVEAPILDATSAPADIDFDLDLDANFDGEKTVEGLRVPDLDIDLGAAPDAGNTIDFDLGDSFASAPAGAPAPPLDLSAISLDLDEPVAPTPADSAEVANKLELAQAYEEMGDRDGARELLQEVLAEGSEAQKEIARNKLTQLG